MLATCSRSAPSLFFVILLAMTGCASWVVPSDGAAPRDARVLPDAGTGCVLPDGTMCPVGQTCPAGDGCNSCACASPGSLACTEQACTVNCTSGYSCQVGEYCEIIEGRTRTVVNCHPMPPACNGTANCDCVTPPACATACRINLPDSLQFECP